MNIKSIESKLKNIRDKYARIKEMTETLDIDSNSAACITIIEQRSCILSEIDEEKNRLEQDCRQWRRQCKINPVLEKIRSEIQMLMSAAIALDSMIQDKLARKIEKVRTEISDLSQTSKAALSYAKHKV